MKERILMSTLFPIIIVLLISAFAGGLGILFMYLYSTQMEEWAVIILGVILVIAVAGIAALLQKNIGNEYGVFLVLVRIVYAHQ